MGIPNVFLKTTVGQRPPETNILMKGEEISKLTKDLKEVGGRGHLTPNQQLGG
jgi:hypothetical protein